ncbi:transposase [Bradyrhizobium sp. Arg68]|nr:transposase [Bradyrhizobium ivorense]
MARLYGRSPRGERCRAAVPHGHWKTTTFTAGLRSDGLIAPLVLDGPMDGDAFLAYVEQLLAPSLRPGDTVIMDMCGRPRRCKKNLFKERRAWSVADMCPASDAAVTCRRPVWEFAERVQLNFACSKHVSMIWFSRSPSL